MLEDLTMLATLPVDEADKAAAGETMPPPKEKDDDPEPDGIRDRGSGNGEDS